MPCVPCQVILWNDRLAAMLGSVNKIVEMGKAPKEWQERFNKATEAFCTDVMDPLLYELTYGDVKKEDRVDQEGA